MKIFLLVSFLLVGFVCSTPVETSESSEMTMEELKLQAIYDYLSKKCTSENDSTMNATEIFKEINSCLEVYSPKSPEELSTLGKPGSAYDICESPEKIEKIPECFQPAIDKLRACSDDEEKYMPEFILGAIKSVIKFACADEGKNIQKLFQKDAMECFENIQEDRKTRLHVCEDKGEGFIAMMADGVVTKKELCDVIEADKVCYANYMEKMCPNDTNMKEFMGDLIGAITSQCSK